MNPIFNWLKDSGTQALLVLVGTVAAIIAALGTIFFGLKSLTKRDLSRVEDNTAHLEEVRAAITSLESRSRRQEEDNVLADRARSVSIAVRGQADNGVPYLSMTFTCRQEKVRFTRIELRNERGNVSGEVECRYNGNDSLHCVAEAPSQVVMKWRNDGQTGRGFVTEHVLRVWMLFDGQTRETYRDVPVTLTQASRQSEDSSRQLIGVNMVEGSV